jgi:hypothetical protein
MKNLSTLSVAVLLAAGLLTANAIPINITTSGGVDVVAAPSSDLGDFGNATVFAWLGNDITTYNSLNSTSLPGPTTVSGTAGLTGGVGGTSISLNVSGYDYLFFHWGGQGGGWAQAFYVGGSSGEFTFNSSLIANGDGPPAVGGLSFYSLYGPQGVPDGGSTMLMLGAAFSSLGLVARRLKR